MQPHLTGAMHAALMKLEQQLAHKVDHAVHRKEKVVAGEYVPSRICVSSQAELREWLQLVLCLGDH
jgi:hypothetical protein